MTKPLSGSRGLVHSPAEMAQAYTRWAEANRAFAGITWGIPSVDKRIIPLRPGRMACVIARPGHGKTSLMATIARREAERIKAKYGDEPVREAVVYVSWEQVVEEVEAFFEASGDLSASDVAWGRADPEMVMRQALRRAGLPLWMIGYSLDGSARDAPEMTLENVLHAIESMEEDFEVRPALVLLDYMQIIPAAGYDDRVKRVAEMPSMVKRLAHRLGVPAIVGVQASREVDALKVKLPDICHAQWGSSIEQAADLVLGLWRPALTEELGRQISVLDVPYTVTEQLFLMRMLKQRGDQGRWTWALNFAPQYLRLCEMETRYPDLSSRYDLAKEE